MLTVDTMQRCLPANFKARLNEESVARVNAALTDEDTREMLKDNILGFSSVLTSPHYSLDEYVNAVRYVSYQMMGDTNVRAWAKVFPDRYARLVAKDTEAKDINAHVRHYNLTKLVNEVREQSLIPSYILNADVFQKAINTQARLMATAKSEMVQMQAANSLLTHLKAPEVKKIELDIGVKENSELAELREVTAALAKQQLANIQSGMATAKDIAHQEILVVKETQDGVYE